MPNNYRVNLFEILLEQHHDVNTFEESGYDRGLPLIVAGDQEIVARGGYAEHQRQYIEHQLEQIPKFQQVRDFLYFQCETCC